MKKRDIGVFGFSSGETFYRGGTRRPGKPYLQGFKIDIRLWRQSESRSMASELLSPLLGRSKCPKSAFLRFPEATDDHGIGPAGHPSTTSAAPPSASKQAAFQSPSGFRRL